MTPTARRLLTAAAILGLASVTSGTLLQAQLPQAVGTWTAQGAIAEPRVGAASVVLDDGRTLILGGQRADGTVTDTVVVYDPETNGTTGAGQLFAPRVNAAAARLKDGRVVVSGGQVGGAPSADIEIFDPAAGTSTFAATMAAPRAWHAAARLHDNRVLIVGGATTGGFALATAEIFDSETSSVSPTGSMATPRMGLSATTMIEGRVLVVGGNNGIVNGAQDLASAEIFDSFAGSFLPVSTSLRTARSGHTALLLPHNAGVLIAGGTTAGTSVTAADLFLPAIFPDPYSWGIGAFAPTGALTAPRAFGVSGPAGDEGFAYAAGGGSDTAETYRYATIKTDKNDYAPGELAVITGSGWQPGEAVTLIFQEDPAAHEDYSFAVEADALGNISWGRWAPEDHDLGVRFYLTAQGSVSRAQTTFTDAKGTQTVVSSNLNPSSPGQSVTFTATVTETGNGGGTPGQPVSVGSMSFREGGNNCNSGQGVEFATATLNSSGEATATTMFATGGSRTIRACYIGTGGTGTGDSSGTVTQDVNADATAPTVSSITRAQASPTNAATVSWNVNFSESVTGVDATDFSLAQFGLTGAPAITGVSGSGSSYTVSATTGNGTGTLGLNLNDNDSIADAAGNKLGGTGTGNGSAVGQVYSLDRTLTAVITINNKPYDGTVAATISSRTFTSGALTVTADVQVSGGAATFVDANAGMAKTVNITGLSLTGTDAARYVLASTTATAQADITRVAATVSVTGYTGTYDAVAHGAFGTATGVGGVDLSAQLNFGATFTDVPGGTAHWTFTGGTNYTDQSGDAAIVINQATATVNVTGYTGTYDAAAHGASGSATGVGGVNLSGQLNLGATFTDVPGGTAHWTFSGGTNYTDQSGDVAIVINRAVATVNVTGYTGTYDAAAHGASGSATGLGGVNLSGQLNLGASFTDVPGGTAHWIFTGGTNYTDQSGEVAIVINQAVADVNVTGYTGTYDAAAHGATGSATGVGGVDLSGQLNLGASFTDVPGGTAHWIFTGGTNYTDQSGDVAVVINQAVADVNVTGYTGTYDAAAHGATGSATGVGGVDLSGQLNLGVSFTDVPGGTAHWAFTGGTNYTDQSGDVAIVINQAVAEVSVTGYTGTYDAQAHGASGSATGVGGVNLSGQLNLGATFTDVPGGTAHWTFSGGTNYTDQSGDAPIVINQAVANVNVTGYAGTYDAAAHGATGSATGVGGVNLSGQLNLGATFTDVPGGTAHWTFTGGTNYTDQSGDVAVVITVRALSVSGVTANNKPFDGNASATLNFGAAGLVGVIAPDAVTLYTGSATGTFASSAVGSWTVTVAGLTIGGTDSGNYRLIQPTTTAAITAWKLSGFFQPVGIPNTSEGAPLAPTNGVWNTIKGGQTVPLKFELFTSAGGTELTSVSDVTGFVVTGAVCSAGPEDWVENTLATTGGTTLRYADGQFIVNWVTPKGANNCYRVTMTARDGSQLSAFFKTK